MSRIALLLLFIVGLTFSQEKAQFVQTPYQNQKPFKAVFELFLDHPEKLGPALGWVGNLIRVLTNPPYNFSPEEIDIVVVSHGREIPVFAKANKGKYSEVVERLESLSQLGVKFKICGMAARGIYGLTEKDFYPFVELVPSAIPEILYWQQKGYGLLIPNVIEIRGQHSH